MAGHAPKYLPDFRRVVTGHNGQGLAVVLRNGLVKSEPMETVKGARGASIWVTQDSLPTNDNNNPEDGGTRTIDPNMNFGLVHPKGANVRSTDLAPGAVTPMHRTSSLDFNILVHGTVILITEDGSETRLTNPGDTVVQRGSVHAWKNPGTEWARWISVLVPAEPVVVNGMTLQPEFHIADLGRQ